MAVIRAILWHALGWLLISYGVFQVFLDLGDDSGFWPVGIVLVGFGTWAWVRGIYARREVRRRYT